MAMDVDPIVVPARTGRVVLQGAGALPPDAGEVLLPLARAAIAAELGFKREAREDYPWLREHGACFVTITREGSLRGCIGTLRPHRPLGEDVKANAVAAAFHDPRFSPLAPDELETVALEVSVLSALEPIAFRDEADALGQLRPGVDGLVFEYGHHSATFLPQVWESLKEPVEFLAHLKYKAGLPPDFWDKEVRLWRYRVAKWREQR